MYNGDKMELFPKNSFLPPKFLVSKKKLEIN